jgi:hypothetical protein
MKKRVSILLLGLAVSAARAHEMPIYPVVINLKIERNQIVMHAESHGGYWQDSVLFNRKSLPATNWPAEYQYRAQNYFEKSFDLFLDGNKLASRAFECRYYEEPLREFKTSRVVFDAIYPIRDLKRELSETTLSGKATFFIEEYVHDQKNVRGSRVHQEFLTTLRLQGEKSADISVPIEKPDFSIPLHGFVRTDFQVFWDRVFGKAKHVTSQDGFWLALVGIGLLLWPRPTSFRRWAGVGLVGIGVIKLFL